MLYNSPNIVSPKTFTLIRELQQVPELEKFVLVGGTALALQIGHRNSIDIDLFTDGPFHPNEIIPAITHRLNFHIDFQKENTVLGFIDEVKVDFITHAYPLIKPPVEEEGVRMASLEDIAAMKLNAIINSGKRLKDFADIYFLLEHFSVREMLHFYSTKYPHMNPMMALRCLTYFDDLDLEMDPPIFIKPVYPDEIIARIKHAVLYTSNRY